jgi:hypothetical protein
MIKASTEEVAARIVEGVEADETIIWPAPALTGGGAVYLGTPIALGEMLARQT